MEEDLESVVEALMNGRDRRAQVEAAVRIGEFGRKQRRELADRGVIGPLVSILRSHGGCQEAIEAALFALLALAFGSERNKVRIVKFGAVPVLLSLLRDQSGSVVELLVTAMLILSSCSANRPAIASSETVGALIAIIGGTDHSVQAAVDAISTLQNLAKLGRDTVSLAVAHGGVSSLLEFIIAGEKSSEAVEKAVMLLETVMECSKEAVLGTARSIGGIRALVEVVEDGTPLGKEHASAVLLLACQADRQDGCRESILREGAVPGLLQLSVDGTRRGREIAQRLLLLLREREPRSDCTQPAGKRKTQKKHGSKMESVEEIMREIDADGEVVVAATLRMVEEMVTKLRIDQPAALRSTSRFSFAPKLSGRLLVRTRSS